METITKQYVKNIGRRQFINRTVGLAVGIVMAPLAYSKPQQGYDENPEFLKIALLHINPQLGALENNCRLIEFAMREAAAMGAKWLVTPELCLSGYRFDLLIGTDWIKPGPDQWVQHLQKVAAELQVTLFLGHLEQNETTSQRHNTVFVINEQGEIVGRHQKINTIPISEAWSQPGKEASPIQIGDINVGVLICADAWPPHHATTLKEKGAELIISCANWAPGKYGPKECWKKRSLETGLPLFVCNRTGVERHIDMTNAESVVASNGRHLVSHSSENSSLLLVDWDRSKKQLVRIDRQLVGMEGAHII